MLKQTATELLADFDESSVDSEFSNEDLLTRKALYVAKRLQQRANDLQTPQEKRQQAELDRMMQSPSDKVTLVQMTDQAFRARRPSRAVEQLTHILDVQGVPRFFSPLERTMLKGFQSFGGYLPGVAAPLVKEKMQQETANVVLPAEEEMLNKHLRERHDEGVRMNVNFLGEALLGEEDAQRRLRQYLQALQQPEIEVISVKVSTIYSQIRAVAFEESLEILCDRLELLYRAAAKTKFVTPNGEELPKFVYLDMEEYRDLHLTAAAFMQTLDRPGLEQATGGIALQAYVPDSYLVQEQVLAWARERVANGGAPITIRVVKGANMEMERVESSLGGWPQAPYQEKIDTDANYKRMLITGMKPENAAATRLGVASHNLFDVAFGLVLAIENDVFESVQFEMLEGMANHQRRALFELTNNMLLYAPACKQEDFLNAIGYLIRRLDENTGPHNFLRHAFKLKVDTEDWKELARQFVHSYRVIEATSTAPRRQQNRQLDETQTTPAIPADVPWQEFVNEPDTDFCLPQNRQWSKDLVERWKEKTRKPYLVPLVIAGETISDDRKMRDRFDPSRPEVLVSQTCQATSEDIAQAVACAVSDDDGWAAKTPQARTEILRNVAQEFRKARGRLMAIAMAEGGKTLEESDPEVSEAIDFVEFYPRTAEYFHNLPGVTARGLGPVAVISPWNFPIAIPCGGIAAALAAGNTVILKPASDTALTAYELCRCFWRGGVSKKTLQFAPCSGGGPGAELAGHEDIAAVILTGGTATAQTMLAARPKMHLLAETGGKNATIVTALSDREQAIKHVVQSAFGHAGQKCSATSLLILEEEVFNDEGFKATLCDAVESIVAGSAWDLDTRMGPMIRPPSGELESGLKELEPGESWAVLPHRIEDNPHLYSPAVKWNVQPQSFTHTTEFFGPVLGVMKAANLDEAIELVNATGFGLTSGLESLDEREQEIWLDSIRAGNLYINRGTTGAIVLRQPFGGMGKSAFGPGLKAGGPNYVTPLMQFEGSENRTPGDQTETFSIADPVLAEFAAALNAFPGNELLIGAIASYDRWCAEEFSQQHDHFRLVGQDNFRRYLPIEKVRIRIHADDTDFEIFARVAAAKAAGCHIALSHPPEMDTPTIARLDELTYSWAAAIEFLQETDKQLAERIRQRQTDRVRYAAPDRVPTIIRKAAAATGIFIADTPVLAEGRIEMLTCFEEQSLCVDYHRYGNLGDRSDEVRSDVM